MCCLYHLKKILPKYCLGGLFREKEFRTSPTSKTPPLTRPSYPLLKGKVGGYSKPHRGLDCWVGLCVLGGCLITFSIFTHLMFYCLQIIKFTHSQIHDFLVNLLIFATITTRQFENILIISTKFPQTYS